MNNDGVTGAATQIRLTLFVASNSNASTLAVSHLRRALETYDSQMFDLEIVDVFAEPQLLLRESILMTPTLLAKELGHRVVGDLSNATLLNYFLESLLKLRSDRT